MSGRVDAIDRIADPLKGGDIYRWAVEQAALIREGRFDQVDIINVADEIEDVGRSDYRALESRISVVLLHIIKGDYQPRRRSRSWSNSIFEHRLQIERLLKQSPSLQRRLPGAVAEAYSDARRLAAREAGLILQDLPEACSYEWSDILMRPYERGER